MRPENTSVSLRRDLAAVVSEYDATAAAQVFIGGKAAPRFPVPEQSGNYPIFRRDMFKKPADTTHADGAGYNRLQGKFGNGSYATEEHGLEYPITDRRRRLYATFFDAEKAGATILRHQLLLARERRVAALWVAMGLTNHAASTAWHTAASAVPLTDLQTGIDTIQDACGIPASMISFICPRAGFRECLATAQVVDKSKYTFPGIQPANLSAMQLAAMLGIKEVLVAEGVYDSAAEGETETSAQVWGSTISYLAVLAPENSNLETPSAARTMVWTGYADGIQVETYRDDTIKADIVREIEETDEVACGPVDLFAYQLTF